ncbi:MAG TPA: transglutaminaseTgpA domain-containing protein, partial [Acidimicrobiales bacterium]|nr:transglutaminaseTgpA domain-containing protein [Acidimicrobiales bacterium]
MTDTLAGQGLGTAPGRPEPPPWKPEAREPSRQHGLLALIIKANAPPPPEHSWLFRAATQVAVLTGLFACVSTGELSVAAAIFATVAITAGMTFSAATRRRPWQWVKILLAVAVLAVFVDFVMQLFGVARTGELTSVEVPLSGLFVWVQVVHSFDVPARRDLLFSVAAAAALVTVAGAQAQSTSFLAFVIVWLVSSLVCLACSWRSMSGGEGRLRIGGLAGATVVILAVAVVVEVVLPAPKTSQAIHLPASLSSVLPLPSGTGLTEGGSGVSQPAQAGQPGTVGGFVGMAGPLDTALRGALGNEVVFNVRADRPGYFLGLTYTDWNGQSWINPPCGAKSISGPSPFLIPVSPPGGGAPLSDAFPQATPSSTNIQTFYIKQPLPNLLFSTSTAYEVYFDARSLEIGCDNSIRSTVAMTAGTVYTVLSADDEVAPRQLASVPASVFASPPTAKQTYDHVFASELGLPKDNPYARVAALARTIVAKARPTSLVGVVEALENWIGDHTEYSLDIPPLSPGQDPVNTFLFVTKKGFCEQISTSLAVMLRTLGIPAREATGYVPGSFDPLSDLYTVQAKDAHAWVQVYFPGYGWQSFDPTAYVPLAPADPGAVLLSDIGRFAKGLPWLPIGLAVAAGAAVYGEARAMRRRRA